MGSPFFDRVLRYLLERVDAAVRASALYVRFNHLLFVAVLFLSAASFWLAYELRFDFSVPVRFNAERMLLLPYVAVFKILAFYLLKGHATHWRYVGLKDLPILLLHSLLGSVTLLMARQFSSTLIVPKGVIIIDFFLSFLFVSGARVGIRYMRELAHFYINERGLTASKRVVIIGAGDSGEMLVREIARKPESGLKVLSLFDDDARKWGVSIHGVKVRGGVDDVPAFVVANQPDMAIIAIPSANHTQMKRIFDVTRNLNMEVKTLPAIHEIIEGLDKLTQLRDINIADLLGREEVRIDSQQVRSLLRSKTVVVTGAGGSIGGELCRQIIKRNPGCLILMERSENSLYDIHRQLTDRAVFDGSRVIPVLCDVRDGNAVNRVFARFRPDLVFHAGAHKHVPMQELNPAECFSNNVGGLHALATACDRFGVSTFVLISTDKAVNPTSVMGATKRVGELYCQAFSRVSTTTFLAVRFGNVLASQGSAIPLFLDQVAKGGPVTITHPDMCRYFMTISEAVTLVLQAAALGNSGQILILEMGEPIKIVDMVHQLVQLTGKRPGEIPIEYIGMRPGEKLRESLCSECEQLVSTRHGKIKAFDPPNEGSTDFILEVERALRIVNGSGDPDQVRLLLEQFVPEFNQSFSEADARSDTSPPSPSIGVAQKRSVV
jgi:FlaA1/EpsC-like NDP-sugar epimerase